MENQNSDVISQNKNFFQKLSRNQKASLLSLAFIVIILPIATALSLLTTRLNPRAFLPMTPPITPTPTIAVCQNAVRSLKPASGCIIQPSPTPRRKGITPTPIKRTPGYRSASIVCANGYTETYRSSTCLTLDALNRTAKSICQSHASCPTSTPTPTSTPSSTPTPTVVIQPNPVYYLKTSDWITASPNIASTVIHGCNAGDMAISGGMDGYSGPISAWRTVRSGPTTGADMNSWQTTVVNQDTVSQQFTVTVKCLTLNK